MIKITRDTFDLTEVRFNPFENKFLTMADAISIIFARLKQKDEEPSWSPFRFHFVLKRKKKKNWENQ